MRRDISRVRGFWCQWVPLARVNDGLMNDHGEEVAQCVPAQVGADGWVIDGLADGRPND